MERKSKEYQWNTWRTVSYWDKDFLSKQVLIETFHLFLMIDPTRICVRLTLYVIRTRFGWRKIILNKVHLTRFSSSLSMIDSVSSTQPCHEMDGLLIRRIHKFYKKERMQVNLDNLLKIIKSFRVFLLDLWNIYFLLLLECNATRLKIIQGF